MNPYWGNWSGVGDDRRPSHKQAKNYDLKFYTMDYRIRRFAATILLEAIRDLKGTGLCAPVDAKQKALNWINGANSKITFKEVCDIIGLDSELMQSKINRLMK